MATTNYRLKKGYIAQFDIAYKGIKAFSNDQMTDDLAGEFLKRYPSRVIYFDTYLPLAKVTPVTPVIPKINKVIPKAKKESSGNILADTMKDINAHDDLGDAPPPKTEVIPADRPAEVKLKTLSQMNKTELVVEAIKYEEIENPDVYSNFDLANLIRKATGVKEIKAKK